MGNINIDNISNLDLDGRDLFEDSESYITELNDEGESIVGGYFPENFCGVSNNFCGVTEPLFNCGNTFCGNTIGFCGDTANCGVTLANPFG